MTDGAVPALFRITLGLNRIVPKADHPSETHYEAVHFSVAGAHRMASFFTARRIRFWVGAWGDGYFPGRK
jgi:hypothetical protein